MKIFAKCSTIENGKATIPKKRVVKKRKKRKEASYIAWDRFVGKSMEWSSFVREAREREKIMARKSVCTTNNPGMFSSGA